MYQGKQVRHSTRFCAWIILFMIGIIYSVTIVAVAVSFTKESEEKNLVVRAEEITATLPKVTMPEISIEELEENMETLEASLVMYDAKPESYIIKSGDTLWWIANHFYGDGLFYPYLMKINDLESITVREGQTLKIEYFDESEREVILAECYDKINESEYSESESNSNISYTFSDSGIPSNAEPVGKFKITGYDPHCYHCCNKTDGITKSGKQATFGRTIAADLSRYPLGTKLYIEGLGTFTVEDSGGSIKGNKIDVAVPSHAAAYNITGNYNVYLVK